MDAELGDVAALGADPGCQHQGHHLPADAIHDYVRDLCGESSGTGKADDVVEKAHGAVDRAVLVVDHAVGMAVVSRGDKPPGGIQVLVAPGTQLQRCGQVHAWRGTGASQLPHHKETPVNLEA